MSDKNLTPKNLRGTIRIFKKGQKLVENIYVNKWELNPRVKIQTNV